MHIPRLIIAGVTSNVGKTSISIAIMHALIKKGYKVQGFKVGPDYIDPSYHKAITNRDSRNLDAWLMSPKGVLRSFINASKDADISVIEGVMGLFDGLSGKNDFASTAHIARLLKAPTILVIDASKVARSIAAIAYGFIKFDPRLEIAGVIVNNIASNKHAEYCIDALKPYVKVLGVVRRSKNRLEERHLGLIPTDEHDNIKSDALKVAEEIAEQLDIDEILKIAYNAKELPDIKDKETKRKSKVRIGLALDNSFNFYYSDNIDRLRKHGADITIFSPINDHGLEDVDGLYIGGGFPEVLAEKLASNASMLNAIKRYAEDNMPIYAECGGLMYLARSITDNGRRYRMVGLFDLDTLMSKHLTLNYTYATCINDSIILASDSKVKGHEFHYSYASNVARDARFAYLLKKGKGIVNGKDGMIVYNTLASYMHLYFNDKIVDRFIRNCSMYARR